MHAVSTGRNIFAVVAIALLATAAEARAQAPRDFSTTLRSGVGYTGVIPDAVAGVGAWSFLGRSPFGVFVDAKTTLPRFTSRDSYCPPQLGACTVAWVDANRNDMMIRDEKELLIVNGGVLYTMTPEFALMLGAGAARVSYVREYFHETEDDEGRIGDSGSYFVDRDPAEEWLPQAVAGVLLRAGRNLTFRFGYETVAGGMSIGIYWALP